MLIFIEELVYYSILWLHYNLFNCFPNEYLGSLHFSSVIVDSHAVLKNNTELSLVHSVQCLPMIIFCKLYYNMTKIFILIQSAFLYLFVCVYVLYNFYYLNILTYLLPQSRY